MISLFFQKMSYSSSDSDAYYTASEKAKSYFAEPSAHHQKGGDLYEEDQNMIAEDTLPTKDTLPTENTLPILNASQPEDHEGSPISSEDYMDIPLSPKFADVLAIKIKRTAFMRQKVSVFSFLIC